jgi:hypothetical protein
MPGGVEIEDTACDCFYDLVAEWVELLLHHHKVVDNFINFSILLKETTLASENGEDATVNPRDLARLSIRAWWEVGWEKGGAKEDRVCITGLG